MLRTIALLGTFLFTANPCHAGVFKTCANGVLNFAGYYGVGPRAFPYRQFAGRDRVLVDLLARLTTSGDDFTGVVERVDDLEGFGPWKDYGWMTTENYVTPDLELGTRYVGQGIVSSTKAVITKKGFPIKAHFTKGPSVDVLSLRFYLPSAAHREAFASLYAGWISEMGELEMEETSVQYYELPAGDGTLNAYFSISLCDMTALNRWLTKLAHTPENGDPIFEESLRNLLRAFHEIHGGEDLPRIAVIRQDMAPAPLAHLATIIERSIPLLSLNKKR